MTNGIGPAGKLGRFFIDSKLTPLLVVAALALGALAISLTPREEEPQIIVPMVNVFVGLPGASPTEVENRVTVPLEKRMWEIPGVEYVYSTSMPSTSLVTVRFFVGEDQQQSLVKVYDKLASGLDRIPPGATTPLVKVRSIDDVPVLGLTLWSGRYDGAGLRRIAAELGKELARLEDVSEVKLIGGERRQVRVLLDPQRLAASGLDPAAVAQALTLQNAASPAGSFEEGNREVLVETGAFLTDAGEVADLVVGVHGGRPVYLRQVAEVVDGSEEVASYVSFLPGPAFRGPQAGTTAAADGGGLLPAVTVTLAKRKGADAHRVVAAALAKVEQLRGRLVPPEVGISVTRDYGATASEKADELLVHLSVAILSVTLVIGLFLGWRGALVVFIAVPVSFALTLFVYYLFGYTLNRVTLFALVFVTGIVVDDSIIVVENMVRHFAMKRLPPMQAAITAVDEVGNPTILATLTVIAAVLPMAFVRGLMGPYMRPMPVGASLAMTFSLLVALVAAPWFAYRLLRGGSHGDGEEGQTAEETRTYRVYRRIMEPLMERPRRRWLFLGAVAVLLVAAIALFPLQWVTVKMLPFDNKSELQVIVDMPEGTTLETTQAVARDLGAYLRTVPEVTDLELYAGTAAPINFNGLVRHYDLRRGPTVADLQVNFVHKDRRHDQSHDLARRIRPEVEAIAARHGAAVKIAEVPPGPPVLSTLVAEVYGPDDASRLALASQVKEVFATTDGVVDVDWSMEAPQPKRVFTVDREKAALAGVGAAQVARTLRLALSGEDEGLLHRPDEAEPVTLRLSLPRSERSTAADLGRVRVLAAGGAAVPLGELVRVGDTVQEPSRYRKNLKPVVYVTGDVAGRLESPVYAILAMADRIASLTLPDGGAIEQDYRRQPWSEERPALKWDGEWHITYEVFRDLGVAFGLVLVLIYLLIIAWFRSFTVPLVMMIAIPLSLVGILPGHWLFGAFFTATSMIGLIALAGIMVRNSVLLIDFVNLSRERGKSLHDAVLEAGAVRFRPILLTAGTVVVGAFVILFDPIFQGLAISLMTGAFASTVLTLVVVPLVHFLVERRKAPEGPPPAPEEALDAARRSSP
jgi:multidrug efflux pump subunit AcrB